MGLFGCNASWQCTVHHIMSCHHAMGLLQFCAAWGMRVGIDSQLYSISAFSTDLQEFKLHKDYSGISKWTNLYNPIFRRKSSSLSPSLSPCRPCGNHSRRLLQKTIEGLDCKINGRTLGAALRHSFGVSDWWAQTEGVLESAAVAAGPDRFAWGKRATTRAIPT